MTDVPVSQEAREVTQADREGAADLMEQKCLPGDLTPTNIRLGNLDDGFAVQAFARHRQQAERDVIARMEVVAWMYVRKTDAWPAAPNVVSNDRWPTDDPARPYWNEFALYALPTPPEAA